METVVVLVVAVVIEAVVVKIMNFIGCSFVVVDVSKVDYTGGGVLALLLASAWLWLSLSLLLSFMRCIAFLFHLTGNPGIHFISLGARNSQPSEQFNKYVR